MPDTTNQRKAEHIDIVNRDAEVDRRKFYFDDIRLRHRALPEIDLARIDTSVAFMGKRLAFPLLISCMTGGDHDVARTVNINLAKAAEAAGVAMGVGSQRVMFTNPAAKNSFDLRPFAPNALLFANLGAVQLNYGFSITECRAAVDALQADALCLHLNPLQEAVQPEGDTNFAGLADKIGSIAKELGKPVIVKEIGAGISPEDARLLAGRGVKFIDVAGAGGTSWSRIEHHRGAEAHGGDLGLVFQDWGIPTPEALAALKPFRDKLTLIASGGIRSGIDMAKAMSLGASLCGVASPLLRPAMESADKALDVIAQLHREFRTALFLLGIDRADKLIGNDSLIMETR
jgi:isopentenyl-diphosphate delta-isomerase